MLTVYSTQGSPGASTTALHLAAHWASMGREVLLIEADPAGGSLSRNLGIQFTPGSASFVASGLPVLSSNLIDHAQDVLFENLHVMPAPATPAGATGIFRTFADSSDDLRTIAENDMAMIIDGGRITADTAVSMLTTGAAGVLVVCRDNSQLSSLEPLRRVFAAGPEHDGPRGFVATVGKSPIGEDEWLESYGLTFCGAIGVDADMAADIAGHLNRNKRKSKKWRHSLERVGEQLYPYAQPPPSGRSRQPRPADQPAPPGTEPADPAGLAAAAPPAYEPVPPGAYPPAAPEAYPPAASEPVLPGAYPPAASEPGSPGHYLPPGYEPAPSEAYPPGHYPPVGYEPAPPEAYPPMQYPPEAYPRAPYPAPGYEPAPPETYPPETHPPEAYPPEAYAPAQHPPPAYEPGPSEAYAPGHYPPAGHEPAPPEAYAPAGYEQGSHPHAQPPAHGQVPPLAGDQPGSATQPLADEPPPAPDIQPSGSFRDWAAKLHGSEAEDQAAQNQGV